MPYYQNVGTFPHGCAGLDNINADHATWNTTYSDCGWPDVTDMNMAYAGTTTTHASTSLDSQNVYGVTAGGC